MNVKVIGLENLSHSESRHWSHLRVLSLSRSNGSRPALNQGLRRLCHSFITRHERGCSRALTSTNSANARSCFYQTIKPKNLQGNMHTPRPSFLSDGHSERKPTQRRAFKNPPPSILTQMEAVIVIPWQSDASQGHSFYPKVWTP